MHFLGIAFRIGKITEAQRDDGTGVTGSTEQALEELWLAQASLDLVARTEALRGAAFRYAVCLAEITRGGAPDNGAAGVGLTELQARFMDAAYEDLWPGSKRRG